jgi:hypothetical protein
VATVQVEPLSQYEQGHEQLVDDMPIGLRRKQISQRWMKSAMDRYYAATGGANSFRKWQKKILI